MVASASDTISRLACELVLPETLGKVSLDVYSVAPLGPIDHSHPVE